MELQMADFRSNPEAKDSELTGRNLPRDRADSPGLQTDGLEQIPGSASGFASQGRAQRGND
jgi:hypothetical protein